ncbi:MAG: xanthine dehydrogenase YagT iron-sulfur-binding subunit [Rhodospirillaceae bacterium]|nr:xanthine dehydrogenase YagT iron-sulfur-binding subunit [Rhodospirillaceae bacterium]
MPQPIVGSGMHEPPHSITRRVLGITALVMAAFGRQLHAQPQQQAAAPEPRPAPPDQAEVHLTVNSQPRTLSLDPRTTLLDALRDHLGLPGTKKGCDHGQCGACTVLVNGVRLNSCLSLAVMRDGDSIVTVEGLAEDGKLHPVQQAFVKHDGFQCGYCTPGQICSTVGMLDELKRGLPSAVTADLAAMPAASAAEIRERMSGNICRCAAYPNIVAAIMEAQQGSAG